MLRPALTGLAVFVNFLPVVLAGFFGGVIVDRLGYRFTSIVADLASAAAVVAIPLLHSTVGLELWELLILVFLGALLDAPGATARVSLFPDLVERAGVGMERANGIRGAIQQGSWLVGAPIAGILVAKLGATTALWLDAASFLVSAALVGALVPAARRVVERESSHGYLAELAEGLRFIWSRRIVRALVVTVLITNLLDAPFPVVMPVFAREAFGSAADLGLMYGVFGGAGRGTFARKLTAENDYLIDRSKQKTVSYSGIDDFVSHRPGPADRRLVGAARPRASLT